MFQALSTLYYFFLSSILSFFLFFPPPFILFYMERSTFLKLPSLVQSGDAYSSLTVTNLDLKATQIAFEQGKQAYATQNYSNAVNLFSEAIASLQADLAVILLHRAAAHEMQENYNQAVDDGHCAESFGGKVTLWPDPYVTQGNALLLQCKLNQAATIFKKGAHQVPSMHPRHTQLANQYHQIMHIIDQHNQWLVQLLPYEVLSSILSHLSIKDRGRLALTCRFWFDYILRNWTDMWSCINVTKDLRTCRGFHSLLRLIPGDKVKHVVLHMVQSYPRHIDDNLGYNSMMVLKTMRERQWNQVEYLDISEFNKKQLEGVLLLNKYSLRRLALSSDFLSIYRNGALSDAPKICQKLETITARIPQQYVKIPAGLIPPTIPQSDFHLTALEVSPDDDEPRHFVTLLRESPMLQSLKISSQQRIFSYWEVLQILHRHCPMLEIFHYTPKTEPSLSTYTRISKQQLINTKKKNIKELVLRPGRGDKGNNTKADTQLGLIFQKAHLTLESLDMATTVLDAIGEYNSLETLAQLGAPQMKRLTVTSKLKNADPLVQVLAKLIMACPSLREVDLLGRGLWNQHIFEALATRTQLRRLSTTDRDQLSLKLQFQVPTLSYIPTGGTIAPVLLNTPNLYDFVYDYQFNTNINISDPCQQASLAPFTLELTKLVGMSSIRHFELISIRLWDSILLDVLENLRHSQIRHLKIRMDCQIGGKELEAFASMEHLEYLFVHDDSSGGSFDKSAMYELFERQQKKKIERLLAVHIQYSESVCDYLTGCKRNDDVIPSDCVSLDQRYLIKEGKSTLSSRLSSHH
ncbi:hypothetical protein BDA99DRAFT_567774 [Phascolomyces articulosus]|uniref:F-box domain-containing protein n=1 Tax=Phascolomyces articulosus TaxID=60185 RepID=A0AAD5PJL0_9FUNG|nr:hypothetical protein BDA99DRAFT_567774 [Phascolomyces articulosus]